jgi:hypothetical protein
MESEAFAEMLNKPGWTYRDLPKMKREFINELIEIAGQENLQWITYAEYKNWGKEKLDLARGQILISPEGMERIAAFNKVN